MPPKGATKAAATNGMSEEMYFFYAALRVLMAQSDSPPNWDLIAEAIGGKRTGHTLYCRIDKLKKTAMPAFGEDVPDLEQFIADAVATGRINKKGGGKKRAAVDAGPKIAKKPKKDAAKNEECDVKPEADEEEDLLDEAV